LNLLLDTNVISKLIRGRELSYRQAAEASLKRGDMHYTSVIVQYELEYGAAKSPDPELTRKRYQLALATLREVLAFTSEDAMHAAEIRATLGGNDQFIGEYDITIAAQALRTGFVLVTNNTKHFRRVAGLVVVDWSKA
jgi:tRNA(fMet)-specific endonuclease VapC